MGTLISGFQEAMMPRGPKGEKRPADVIGNAVTVRRDAERGRKISGQAIEAGRRRCGVSRLGREIPGLGVSSHQSSSAAVF
jgi:hypothetical protein